MTPRLRKLALIAHITFSVGWLGAVAAFLVLSLAGLTSRDANVVRGAYLAMDLIGRFMIVPMSLLALASGLLQALGTQWGLFRYYWVAVKFFLTLGAAFLLLLHQFTAVTEAARRASVAPLGTMPEIGPVGTQLVGDASLGILVLLVTTTLSVFKPWGKTQYARRSDERISAAQTIATGMPLGLKVLLLIMGAVVVLFIGMHVAGGGHTHH